MSLTSRAAVTGGDRSCAISGGRFSTCWNLYKASVHHLSGMVMARTWPVAAYRPREGGGEKCGGTWRLRSRHSRAERDRSGFSAEAVLTRYSQTVPSPSRSMYQEYSGSRPSTYGPYPCAFAALLGLQMCGA